MRLTKFFKLRKSDLTPPGASIQHWPAGCVLVLEVKFLFYFS